MAFPGSWTVYKSNASEHVALDTVNVIVGASSLRMHRNGTTGRYVNCERSGSPKAFTSGQMRWLMKLVTNQTGDWVGAVFQQSAADLTGGAGSAYGLGLQVIIGGTTGQIELVKFTAGLGTRSTITTGAIVPFSTSELVALRLDWELNLAALNGLRVTVSYGALADFSDLTEQFETIITTSVLTTSAAEGPAVSRNGTTSPGDYLWDQMSANPVVVGG